jgi:mono/diheme cytochrome c family protein
MERQMDYIPATMIPDADPMRCRVVSLILALQLSLMAAAPAGGQATRDSLPPGVTLDIIARGKSVFTGAGVCFACHGMDGEGVSGPSLTDSVWIHSRGEYDKIVQLITVGIDAKASKSGVVMPPRGGSAINDADIRAVAAYVWSLGHRRTLN